MKPPLCTSHTVTSHFLVAPTLVPTTQARNHQNHQISSWRRNLAASSPQHSANDPPIKSSRWSTFPRLATPTARARSAASTPSTRSPSTRPAKPRYSPRESAVTTASSPVTVVRPSPSSTRRPRPPRRSSSVWSASSARPSASLPSSVASTSSWVVTRRRRVLLWFSKCVEIFGVQLLQTFPCFVRAYGHSWISGEGGILFRPRLRNGS